MRSIAKKFAPINVIVHYPTTDEGKQELAKRVSSVHADIVNQYIQKLSCPSSQKIQLMNAIIESVYAEETGSVAKS